MNSEQQLTSETSSVAEEAFPTPNEDYSQEIYQELKTKREKKTKEKEETTLSKLDRKHMLTILLYLKHNRPAIKTEIYSNISRNVNMLDKLKTLESMGLIGMYDTFDNNTCYVILTDKGEKVAGQIEEMLDTIETEFPDNRRSIYTYWKEKRDDE